MRLSGFWMKIKCAAILYRGRVYEGRSHPEIGHKMLKDGVCPRPFPGGKNQGFVVESGDFVGREVARIIAIESGQLKEDEIDHPTELFSEDLNRRGD